MKLKISLAFVALYIVFVVVTAPASIVTRFIPDNAGIQIGNITGTLWNGKLTQLNYRNQFQLQQLTWEFNWLSLLMFKATADIKFNNDQKALDGVGTIGYGFSGLMLSDANINIDAATLPPYLPLPVEVASSGKLSIVVENASEGTPYCSELDAYVLWHEANVDTPMGSIDFASPSIDLSCSEGAVIASLKQHSEQLTTNVNIELTEDKHYQLVGTIIGRETLAPSILQALSWIGPKNSAGETTLNFEGNL